MVSLLKVGIIGAGYVGLVTATCLAEIGNQVICSEKDKKRLSILKKGKCPIYEPGLEKLIEKNHETLNFTSETAELVDFADIIFICVGTPAKDDGKPDLSQVEGASREIAASLDDKYKLIVEKSTVPVRTYEWVKKTLNRYSDNPVNFDVASNPEFLREGSAIKDFMEPDRIVIGVETKKAEELLKRLYKPLTNKEIPLLVTDPATAEMIKHASNSFLAMKISYINMIADLCEKVGVDVDIVAKGMGYDHRIGKEFLRPGIGYGGSCFPKDVRAFIKIAEEYGIDFNILHETEKINNERRKNFIKKIEDVLWINKDKNIAIWGLSFKPGTDDIREAPSIDIVSNLLKSGVNLRLYDPEAMENFKKLYSENPNIKYFNDKYRALKDADALLILTEWEEFKNPDFKRMKKLMRLPIIIDGRNIFKPKEINGFEYYSIGRKPVKK